MLREVVPLDATQFEAALDRLDRSAVGEDNELFDYTLQQAFRALTYTAVDTAPRFRLRVAADALSAKAADAPYEEGNVNALVRGREALWYGMCRRAVRSAASLRTMAYLSCKLLCDDATSFGEGNEKPFAGDSWAIALLLHGLSSRNEAVKTRAFHTVEPLDRRYLLGHLLLSIGTLRSVATPQSGATAKRIFSHYPQLGEGWFDLLLPKIAQLADGKGMSASSLDAEGRPSVLEGEANHFVLHSFFYLTTDTLATHSEAAARESKAPRLLDRDPPQHLWPAIGLLRRAFARSSGWLVAELAHWRDKAAAQAEAGERRQLRERQRQLASVDTKMLQDVTRHLEDGLSQLLRQQEELHCLRERVREQFGDSAKDFHEVSEMMWSNTLRACYAIRWWTEAHMRCLGGLAVFSCGLQGLGLKRPTSQRVLQHVAHCVAQMPVMTEEKPSEAQLFTAHAALLAAGLTVSYSSPSRSLQRVLWAADLELTQHIQSALSQHGLKYPDARVVELASLLLGSIWSMSADSPLSSSFLAGTSEQLLDLLSQERDAASHCVVQLVSRATVDQPQHFVPSLFRLVECGSRAARQNAMDVLAALPRMALPSGGEAAEGQADDNPLVRRPPRSERMQCLMRSLAEHLLLHLNDEELRVRMQSAQLFAKVDPADVMQPLINLCLQADPTGRRYASASAALTAVVEAHTESAAVLVVLFDVGYETLRGLEDEPKGGAAVDAVNAPTSMPSSKVPQTPGDVLPYAMLYASEALEQRSDAAPAKGAAQLAGRRERVHTLVRSATDRWAAAVKAWQATSHADPLLDYGMHVAPDDVSKQQWAAKTVLGALYAVSATGQLPACEAVIRSLSRYFARSSPAQAPQSQWLGMWLELGAMAPEECHRNVFRASLPLLCLRRCAGLWDAAAAPLDAAGLDPVATLLRDVWECVWAALTDPAYGGCAARLPEFMMVEVEVLHHFQPGYFFSRWHDAFHAAEKQGVPAAGPRGTLYLQWLYAVFLTRVAVQARSTLLQPRDSPAVSAAARERAEATDLRLQHWLAQPLQTLKDVVLPWLTGTGSAAAAPDAGMRKLCAATCELLAALMMFGLLSPADPPAPWWGDVAKIVLEPLHELTALYRAQAAASIPEAESEVVLGRFMLAVSVHEGFLEHYTVNNVAVPLLTAYVGLLAPLLMDVANAAAHRFRTRKTGECEAAVQCTVLLFKLLMLTSKVPADDVAAYAAQHPVPPAPRRAAPEKAVEADNITELSAPQPAPAPSWGVPAPQTVLELLGSSTLAALSSFAVGCLRFTGSTALQDAGVKLFSSMVGIAPEAVVLSNEEALHGATAALQGIARLHPTAATRQVAEHLLQLGFNPTAADRELPPPPPHPTPTHTELIIQGIYLLRFFPCAFFPNDSLGPCNRLEMICHAYLLLPLFDRFGRLVVFDSYSRCSLPMQINEGADDLQLLQFLALSASVHADAMDCAVDELREVTMRLQREDNELQQCEAQLDQLLQDQQRLHSLQTLVAASRHERRRGEEALRGKGATAGYNVGCWSRAATVDETPPQHRKAKIIPTPPPPLEEEGPDSIAQQMAATDVAVERLRAELEELDRSSVRRRLRALERAKHRAAQVDVQAALLNSVRGFRYATAVEALWDPSLALSEREVEAMQRRAARRLTGRYADALELLQESLDAAQGDNLSLEKLRCCYAYAMVLTDASNRDAAAVEQLQAMASREDCSAEFSVHPLATQRTVPHTASLCTAPSVLSPYDFACLPAALPCMQELCETPSRALMPPTETINVPRFSFTDVAEHKALSTARVDLQRRVAEAVVDGFDLLHGLPLSQRERTIAEARLALSRCGRDPNAWCTLVSTESERVYRPNWNKTKTTTNMQQPLNKAKLKDDLRLLLKEPMSSLLLRRFVLEGTLPPPSVSPRSFRILGARDDMPCSASPHLSIFYFAARSTFESTFPLLLSAMARSVFRFMGLLLLTGIFLIPGLSCILYPDMTANYVQQTQVVVTLYQLGVVGAYIDVTLLVRCVGFIIVSAAVFVILGVYRRFFTFFLAVMYALLVFTYRFSVKESTIVTPAEWTEILKDLAVIGGLVFVAFSGKGSNADRINVHRVWLLQECLIETENKRKGNPNEDRCDEGVWCDEPFSSLNLLHGLSYAIYYSPAATSFGLNIIISHRNRLTHHG
eukprot:gene7256-5103_t